MAPVKYRIANSNLSVQKYRIVVPTRDSARWIGRFHREYQLLGIAPIYLYDVRSRDRTQDILQESGAEIIAVEPKHNRVEGFLDVTRSINSADWILRFDDDELPSRALIAWLDLNLNAVTTPCLAVSRRDLLLHDGRLCFSRLEHYYFHPDDPTFLDPQWRGFRPDQVHFTDTIHTPGFEIGTFNTVPASAYFAHFDWMLRSVNERRQKVQRYEAQCPGSGWPQGQFYFPEMHHPESCRWTPLDTDEFGPIVAYLRSLSAAARS